MDHKEKMQNKKQVEETTKIQKSDKTKHRSLALGSIAIVTVAVVIAIAVLVNIIFSNVLTWQIDLTENQDFSMSEEAAEVLATIDKEVEIVGLFDEVKKDLGLSTISMSESSYFTDLYLNGQLHAGSAYGDAYAAYMSYYVGIDNALSYMSVDSVMGILSQFSQENPNIHVSYVDPEANPLFLTNFLGNSERASEFEKGDFIVKCGDVFKRVTSVELCRNTISTAMTGTKLYWPYAPNVDGGFLSAILYVTAETRPVIGVATNHGELELDTYLTILQTSLQDSVFDLVSFNMATETDYSQYDIILMVDPTSDITVGEGDALLSFLRNGGNLIVLADPQPQGTGGLEFTNLNRVLENFNLQINNDKIQSNNKDEVIGNYLYESIIVSDVGPLADVLDTSYKVYIPAARSISYLSKTAASLDASIVVRTSNQAFTSDYTTGEQTGTGSKCIIAAAEITGVESAKIFVSGSASMFADGCPDVGSSVDMLAKVCIWMENSVNYRLPVKTLTAASITVTDASASTWSIVTIAVFPLLCFAVGILIWLRRRHL